MVEYNLQWLKDKGFFRKGIPLELEKDNVLIDEENFLAYAVVSDNEQLEKIRRELGATKVNYIWFYFSSDGRVKVFRRFGEVRWFYYSPRMRSDFLKSRIDKLDGFSPNNVTILFDIRDIINKFYDQLWETRIKMARTCAQLRKDGNKLLAVQHLIDRLIFFYFLSQLKLISIKSQEREWSLDRRSTRDFFKWICNVLSDEDLQEFLNKVFFQVLGKVEVTGWSSLRFNVKGEKFFIIAPSLNGGLFVKQEIEDIPETKIRIKGLKSLILEILNKYNWILGEELPEEEDVIGDLTPEIIGHIYEKFVVSLEQIGIARINLRDIQATRGELRLGRKKIGAYYTPEEITRYISENTIYPYIKDNLNAKFGRRYAETWEKFQEKWKNEKPNDVDLEITKYLYFEVLEKLKVCDNACGSGSFLIAAGEVLLLLCDRALQTLETHLSNDKDVERVLEEIRKGPSRDYHIVKYITTNNLYGVDIAEGAIEIAKLRFWLWLISQVKRDMMRIEPLPNLDFNLMTGNTLVGFVEPEEIGTGQGTFLEPVRPKGQMKLVQRGKQLGFVKGQSITDIMKEIGLLKRRFKLTYDAEARKNLRKEIENKSKPLRQKLNQKLLEKLTASGSDITQSELLELKPFHWGFEFFEIFDLDKPKERRGFDIIIGNPPYVKEFTNRILFEDVKRGSLSVAKYYEGKMDYLYFFIELGIDLLKESGYLSFITTNYWLQAEGARNLREKILSETTLISVFDFNVFKVFEGTGQHNLVFALQKKRNSSNRIRVSIINEHDVPKTEVIEALQGKERNKGIASFVSQTQESFLESLDFKMAFLTGTIENICEKIRKQQNYSLKEEDVAQGIVAPQEYVIKSHLGELRGKKMGEGIFTLSHAELEKMHLSSKEKELIKPFFTSENIGRYFASDKNIRWVIYTDTKTIQEIDDYPRIKEHLRQFRKIITSDFGPYGLHRAREERFFLGEKIISLRKTRQPSFSYVDFPCYVTQTFFIIQPKDINLKYLTAILNSKLIYFWLYFKGKKEGNQLQVDKAPILVIPIKKVEGYQQDLLIECVNKMFSLNKRLHEMGSKQANEKARLEDELKATDAQIDKLVYTIYEISEADKGVIEESLKRLQSSK